MDEYSHPGALDPRYGYYSYAAFSVFVGAALALRSWDHWGALALAVCLAAASAGLVCARIDDPKTQWSMTRWFGLTHLMLQLSVNFLREIPGPIRDPIYVFAAVSAGGFLYLHHSGQMETGDAPPSLLNARSPSAGVRSRYELQIRKMAAQEERHRLARDLHDSIKQQLFAIHISAATAQSLDSRELNGLTAALGSIRQGAREALDEMEALLDQLRAAPLENKGLLAAVRSQCEAVEHRTGAKVELFAERMPPADTLMPGASEALYRIVQEALSNAARHARANSIRVSFEIQGGQLIVAITDDGQGFDPESSTAGMGLRNMRERSEEAGGVLVLNSRPGEGTSVRLTVQLARLNPQRHMLGMWFWAALALACGAAAKGDVLMAPLVVFFLLLLARDVRLYRLSLKQQTALEAS